ncbi:MAG: branched-chain amino acid transport system II carrier protein [Verrucomicrobia bacterium]|nr:branched-chain amino acid transport system II carrier protein [Verrucomicrobiota bacterium]MBS0646562.1 branched-chain amino acid transport system II carrier protein [Verrucomicrobiota bacterium]
MEKTVTRSKSGVIAAGLALFSMFFGAGDLIWPLILGGQSGDQHLFTMLGLLITGVSLPLLGLLAMMLFEGDTHAFFGRIGRMPGLVLLFLIQAILGPIGSLPRLITLAHASINYYFPTTLLTFSVLFCLVAVIFTLKRQKLVDILGIFLAPALILSLAAILILGLFNHPEPQHSSLTQSGAFMTGLLGGYNTLDMIASFIFAPVVISYFRQDQYRCSTDPLVARKHIFSKMLRACLIAGGLLGFMFFGLTYVASYYVPHLPPHIEAERLGLIAMHLLGPVGALFSCVAISLTCLTTAIPIALISADYIQQDLSGNRMPRWIAIMIPLLIATMIANLGFMGIAQMLAPVLQIVCPGLIILCIFNILHKLYEIQTPRIPVYVAFGISLIGYCFFM